MGIVAWMFIIHNESGHFDVNTLLVTSTNIDASRLIHYNGTFDMETWVCDLKSLDEEVFADPCGLEQIQRFAMIPYSLIAFICFCTGVWAFIEDRQLHLKEKMQKTATERRHLILSISSFTTDTRISFIPDAHISVPVRGLFEKATCSV